MYSPGQGKMRPLGSFPCAWLMSTGVGFGLLASIVLLLWLPVNLIEACVATNSMEGSHSWTSKTRGVAQRSAGLVYLFQVCLLAKEQNYGHEQLSRTCCVEGKSSFV